MHAVPPIPELYADVTGNEISGYKYRIVLGGEAEPWVTVGKHLEEARRSAKAALEGAKRKVDTTINERITLDD